MRYISTLVVLLAVGRFSDGASTIPPTTAGATSPVPENATAQGNATGASKSEEAEIPEPGKEIEGEIPPPPPPPLPPCAPDGSCPADFECVGGLCFCLEGYYISGPGNCTKFPGLGDACIDDGPPCYGLGVDPFCPSTKVCKCLGGFEPNKNKTKCTLVDIMVGDACNEESGCTASFSSCQDGKCVCIEGFKEDGKKCTPTEYRCYGEDKPLEKGGSVVLCSEPKYSPHGNVNVTDICGPDHFCNYWQNSYTSERTLMGHCCPLSNNMSSSLGCPIGAKHQNGTCPDYSKIPADAPLPPGSESTCPTTGPIEYTCIGESCCPLPCPFGWYWFNLNGKCFARAMLHDYCAVTAQCPMGAACINGYCHCKPGFVQIDAMPSYCQPIDIVLAPPPAPVGAPPLPGIPGPIRPPVEPPLPGPPAPIGPPPPILIGMTGPPEPLPPPPPARLGEPCWPNPKQPPALCIGEGVDMMCPMEKGKSFCVCRSGYEPSTNQTCKPAVRLVGDKCTTDRDCTAAFAYCQSGACGCLDGFKVDKETKLCVPTEYHCNNGGEPLQEKELVTTCTVAFGSDGIDFVNDTCPAGYTCQTWPKSFPARHHLTGHCCSTPKNATAKAGENITATCPVGVKHPGSCRDLSEFPVDAPLPPDVLEGLCPFGYEYECFEGACCPVPCRTSNSYFNANGRCYEFSYLDGACEVGAQCTDLNTECRNGTCQCIEGFKRTKPNPEWPSYVTCEKI